MKSICPKKTNETGSLKNRSYICLLFILTFFFSFGVNAATFTVSNTNDAGAGSFRQAIIDANANPGADIIDATGVTGTISLLSLLPNITESVTITGPGMALLTINQTIDRRIFTTGAGAVIFVLQDLTLNFAGPGAVPYAGGGGAILAGGAGASTTLTNVTISNFRFQVGNGGAISQSSSLNNHSLTITNCIFTNNKCGGAGGAVSYNGLGIATITGCTFSGNQTGAVGAGTGGDGGAIATTGGGSGGTYLIEKNTFLNNQVLNTSGHAGAITNTNGTSTVRFNRFIGNTCANVANPPLANIIAQAGGATVNITIANNNWWGVNTGPGANDAASTGAGGTMTLTKWLQLKTTASPDPICTTPSGPGNTSTITTSFLSNSANEAIAVSDLSVLIGLPVTWTSTLGSLSGQQTTIQATGTATATFTSNGTGGTATVNAQVDNVPASETSPARASISVNSSSIAPTGATGTTTICNGSSTTLTVDGGSKGTGATTEWFTGSCGGTPEGTGDAITVSPTTTTTYYVRYTGLCNTTTCASVTVTVNTLSTAPTGATGTTTICSGSSTTLTVDGGSKGTGATTEWFTGSCGGTPAGTGDAITVSPGSTTTYYVRYTGTCNTTTCASVTVTVNQPPTVNAPTVVQPTCSTPTGTITVNATGSGTLEYSIDGGTNWFITNVFSGLPPGNYNIAVRSQSAPSCVSNYSGNPVVLNAATGCCTVVATCSNNNPTLYFGYPGDQTATVQVIPTSGVAPYTVSITMNRPLNCNVITSSGDELWTASSGTSVNDVCPGSGPGLLPPVSTGTVAVSGGSYSVNVTLMQDATFTATVTDASNCVATCTTFIHAEDVRCFGGNGGNSKVTICHQTGNNNNPCTNMCVNESAVAGHLAHGDFIGNCTPDCSAPVSAKGAVPEFNNGPVTNVVVTNGAVTKGTIIEKEPVSLDKFQVKVIPNPTENQFTLFVEKGNNEKIVVVVYDVLGRVVKHIEKSDTQLIRFGEDLKVGSYMVIVRQGNNTKTVKLVKQ